MHNKGNCDCSLFKPQTEPKETRTGKKIQTVMIRADAAAGFRCLVTCCQERNIPVVILEKTFFAADQFGYMAISKQFGVHLKVVREIENRNQCQTVKSSKKLHTTQRTSSPTPHTLEWGLSMWNYLITNHSMWGLFGEKKSAKSPSEIVTVGTLMFATITTPASFFLNG